MLKAKDIMTGSPLTVTPDTDIISAARLLLDKGFNGLPVIDENGALCGVICQSDLITQQKRLKTPSIFTLLDGLIPLSSMDTVEKEMKKITAATVGEAMTENPVSVDPSTGLEEIADLMVDKKLYTLPVMDKGKLVGVIGRSDLLRTLAPNRE